MQRQAMASPRLIGRTEQLATIRSAYQRAGAEQTVTALISGEAGIGKTRLVETAVHELPGDPLVLTGGCLELGTTGLPYAAFTTLLRRLVRQLGPRAGIGPALAEWLAGSGPAVADRDESLRFTELESAAERSRLLSEFVALVGRLTEDRPIVLVVEDLHWADDASRDLFLHLARHLPGPGLLLVGTIRSGELGRRHPVRQSLGELRRRADVVTLDLGPLDRAEVGAQLAALTGKAVDPWFAAVIHRRSGGNPLFVESLSGATDLGATNLRELLLERVARLPARLRKVLAVMAVAGAGVPDPVLRIVVDLPGDVLTDDLRALVEHGQIIVDPDGYAFRHDLIREAVYTDLLPAERRVLHRRYAEALTGVDDLTGPDRVPELARHWAAAGAPREALTTAWQASWILHGRTAFGMEFGQLEAVLDHWFAVPEAAVLIGAERVDVLRRAVAAAIAGGHTERGLVHADEALAAVDATTHPERRAVLLCMRARLRNRLDAGGQDAVSEALALFPPGRNDEVRRYVLTYAINVGATTERFEDAAAHCDELAELAGRADDQIGLAWSHAGRIRLALLEGDLDRVRPDYAAAIRHARAAGDEHTLLTVQAWWASSLVSDDEMEEGLPIAQSAYEYADQVGLRRSRGPTLAMVVALAQIGVGQWADAARLLDDTLADDPPPLFGAALRGLRAELAVARGELALAAELIEISRTVADSNPLSIRFTLFTSLAQLEICLATGDPEGADKALDRILAANKVWFPADAYMVVLDGMRVQTARQAAAPRNQAIATRVGARRAELLTIVEKLGEPCRGHLPYLLTIRADARPSRLADWDAAVQGWRRNRNPYQVAQTLTSAAAAALSTSNRAGAIARLREARLLAQELGAVTLLARIDDLATRAGLADTPRQDSAYGLTSRERDVLRALARGLSNRQIAAELFLSPNTVGAHVTRVFAKLMVNSRSEATALALREGLT
ncbi:helix-turn-helix transcriptional regulator [Kribbella catacumbae]|uniref:helix-turn-helix transcriptional regulator n=1 Tax=Kribbella catacumbae TaxID=460086 RepID=UPI0003A6B228|nr:helix-turn-helix transcriptional regulator [Kribbella catacumbae]